MNCNYKVKITDIQTKYKFKVFCTGYDDSEIKEKIDTMYQAWPKATGEGETPTLNNTANATMSIDLKGNTSQYTTIGKNKWSLNSSYVNSTTGNKWVLADTAVNFLAGTYTFSCDNTNTTSNTIFFNYKYSDDVDHSVNFKTSTTLTFSEDVKKVAIRLNPETTITNIMLETGSTATDYEPYTNGASPNPDYPQDVQVVSGDNAINICGKNLFLEFSIADRTTSGLEIKRNSDNTLLIKGTSTAVVNNWINNLNISLNSGTYTFSTNYDLGNKITIVLKDNNSQNITQFNSGKSATFSINETTIFNQMLVQVASGVTIDNSFTFQLEKGTTATTYEAYTGASYPINLGNIELCKIGDYQDYIYKDNKKWYKKEYIRKADITSSTNITMENASANVGKRFNIYDEGGSYFSGNATQAGAISNCYKSSYSTSVANVIFSSSTYGAVSLVDAKYTSVESFKSWAIENLIIYRILSTPTTTEITDTTLISQLNALAGAESYSGQTNISQTNDDKPFILTAKALKDLSNL